MVYTRRNAPGGHFRCYGKLHSAMEIMAVSSIPSMVDFGYAGYFLRCYKS
ncbi:hypothetical protein EPHNCH_0118 [Anaplasma phagocytophilum str. NCH-1]|uniref:Uncharacterized protein n=1 Tax=Anaplasma phagocytophilum str. NCH-1 TaxID=1359161 RepID=A0A0F3NLJ9_ANAPH|nr:hypothetical protein EPHNCH_0118 [Anaplasma phagocytophilum str. NCH-1]KJV86358.1 hypothetical protein APHNYW_1453 [Anaplasma phagocytophilum str. ApNYW]